MNSALAFVLLHARKYDWCVNQCFTVIEVDPSMTLTYLTLGTVYEQKGMYAEAVAAYEKGIAFGGAHTLISREAPNAMGSDTVLSLLG